jgi:hypothetical protein
VINLEMKRKTKKKGGVGRLDNCTALMNLEGFDKLLFLFVIDMIGYST